MASWSGPGISGGGRVLGLTTSRLLPHLPPGARLVVTQDVDERLDPARAPLWNLNSDVRIHRTPLHALLKLRQGRTITPRIAPRGPDPLARLLVLLLHDQLALSKVDPVVALVHLDLVAHRLELINHRIGYPMLERDRAVPPLDVADVAWSTAADQEARGVECRLRMVPVVYQIAAVSHCPHARDCAVD